MKKIFLIIAILLSFGIFTSCTKHREIPIGTKPTKDFTVIDYISDNGIYQADSPLEISGDCEPGVVMVCKFKNNKGNVIEEKYVTANEMGKWKIIIDDTPRPSSKKYQLVISTAKDEYVKQFENIRFGESWLLIGDELEEQRGIKIAENIFDNENYMIYKDGTWQKFSSNNQTFAMFLLNELANSTSVPISIVDATVKKATKAYQWLDSKLIESRPQVKAYLEKNGFEVTYLDVNEEGFIDLEELKNAITDKTILVSIMFANNEIGTIQPIKEIGAICRERKVLFHTDAVQAVGNVPVDVKEMNIDLLSLAGHKIYGPKGIGALYIRKGVRIDNLIHGGGQERARRAGTENIASIVGMAYALKKNCEQIEKNTSKVRELEKDLLDLLGVSNNKEIIKNGGNNTLPGTISLSFKNQNGEAMLHRLDLKGICVSTGSACDGKDTNISHVLKAIKLDEKYANGTIRISLSKNNTKDEIMIIYEEIKRILQK